MLISLKLYPPNFIFHLLVTQFIDLNVLVNNQECNRKTADCLLKPQFLPRGNLHKLITKWSFIHFGLIDTILVIWEELIIVWNLVILGEKLREKKVSQVFVLAP